MVHPSRSDVYHFYPPTQKATVSNQNVTVDRLSSAVLHVEAITTLWGFLGQIAEYQQTRTPRVTYRIKGSIYSGSPSVRLPFDDGGEFTVPIEPTQ